jgi:hypothetical protein
MATWLEQRSSRTRRGPALLPRSTARTRRGWDGRDGVPRLVAPQEMPDRHLMRELRYR